MISYAQNFEDVILNRAFRDQAEGFYIDVGACHPVLHSVTKHFYERGWSGINVEPVSGVFEELRADRGRDINLNLGVSNREGSLTLFEAPSSIGRSTFSAAWCEGWNKHDNCEFVERSVPVTTLARICEQHARRPIDFLKIDVEGHEKEVLEGADFARWRPRVVLVEGESKAWGHLLLDADYRFATFDGVNQYYVRSEDSHLIEVLSAPVSFVDDFVLHEYHQAIAGLQAALAEAHAQRGAAQAELDEIRPQLQASRAEQAETRARIEALQARLGQFDDLGHATLGVARGLRHLAHRHPRLSSIARRLVRRRLAG